MNRFQAALSALMFGASPSIEEKADPTGGTLTIQSRGRPVSSPTDYNGYAKLGYQKNIMVKRGVEIVARATARLPLCLKQYTGGKWRKIDDWQHPLIKLIRQPNPTIGGAAFWENVVSFYLLKGDSYILGNTPDQLGVSPTELYTMRPDRTKIVPSEMGVPAAYEFTVNGAKQTFLTNPNLNQSPILHWKTFNPLDDWYGQPPLQAAAMQVAQHNGGSEWNAALLQNSGRPSGAFVYAPGGDLAGTSLTDKQKLQLEEQMKRKLLGSKNAGLPLILDGGLDWKEMSMNAKELDWLEGQRDAARLITLGFGVPSMLLGIPGDNTFANYKEARLALYVDTVIPVGGLLCDALNLWLTPTYGDDLCLGVDVDKVEALAEQRQARWDSINAAVFISTDEKREAMGFEPLGTPESEEIFIPSSVVPLSVSLDPPAPEVDPATGLPVPPMPPGAKPPPKTPTPPPEPAKKFDAALVELKANVGRLTRMKL